MDHRTRHLAPKCDPCRALVRSYEARLEVYRDCLKTEDLPPAYPGLCSWCDPPAYRQGVALLQQPTIWDGLASGPKQVLVNFQGKYVPATALRDDLEDRVYFTVKTACPGCAAPLKLMWFRTGGCVRATDDCIYQVPHRHDKQCNSCTRSASDAIFL